MVGGGAAILTVGALMAGTAFVAEDLDTHQTITAQFQKVSPGCHKQALDGGRPVCLKHVFTDKGVLQLWDSPEMPVAHTFLERRDYTFRTHGAGRITAPTITLIGSEPTF